MKISTIILVLNLFMLSAKSHAERTCLELLMDKVDERQERLKGGDSSPAYTGPPSPPNNGPLCIPGSQPLSDAEIQINNLYYQVNEANEEELANIVEADIPEIREALKETRAPASKKKKETTEGDTKVCKNDPLEETYVEIQKSIQIIEDSFKKYKQKHNKKRRVAHGTDDSVFRGCLERNASGWHQVAGAFKRFGGMISPSLWSGHWSAITKDEDFEALKANIKNLKKLSKSDKEQGPADCKKREEIKNETKQLLTKLNATFVGLDKNTKTCITYGLLMKNVPEENFSNIEYTRIPAMSQSLDKKVTCVARGILTLDYPGCKDMLNVYTGVDVTKKASQISETAQTQFHAADLMKEMTAENLSDPSKSIDIQKSSIQKQKDLANQRAGIRGIEAATLWGSIGRIPTRESVGQICKKDLEGQSAEVFDERSQLQNLLNLGSMAFESQGEIPGPFIVDPSYCDEVTANSYGMFLNQPAKDRVKEKLIALGFEAVNAGVQSAAYGKQIEALEDAKSKIDNFKPQDPDYSFDDALYNQCQLNPGAPGCPEYDSSGGLADVNVTVAGGESSDVQFGETESDGNSSSGNSGDFASGTFAGPIGGDIAGIDKANNQLKQIIPGSRLKPGQGDVSSGGGGGQASGAGIGGQGLGGQGGNRSARNRGPRSSKLKYDRSAGAAGYGGGGRRGRSSRRPASNPLAGLFGKKKAGKGNQVIGGFGKGQIAGKGVGLFDLLSRRYSSANKKGKLLKYEAAD